MLLRHDVWNAWHWEEQSQEKPTASAVDLAFSDESIVVLAAGSGDLRLRVADDYDPDTCEYRAVDAPSVPIDRVGDNVRPLRIAAAGPGTRPDSVRPAVAPVQRPAVAVLSRQEPISARRQQQTNFKSVSTTLASF